MKSLALYFVENFWSKRPGPLSKLAAFIANRFGTILLLLIGSLAAFLFLRLESYPGVSAKELASFLLGALALVVWVIPLLGLLVSGAGIALGLMARGSAYFFPLAGIAMSSVGLVPNLINAIKGGVAGARASIAQDVEKLKEQEAMAKEWEDMTRGTERRENRDIHTGAVPESDSAQNPIAIYADELVKRAGFKNLSPDYRKKFVAQLTEQAQNKLGLMALSELGQAQMEKFSNLAAQSPPQGEILAFFRQNIADFDRKMQKTLEEFGGDFIRRSKMLDRQQHREA